MTDAFAETLSVILEQGSGLELADEKAVEQIVILPILAQLGWNTGLLAEVYPQRSLKDGSRPDFDLKINGESKIVIEVKAWGRPLGTQNEQQLASYCRLANPKLAVLTNGRRWQLYLPPNKTNNAPLKEFLDFDIAGDHAQPSDVVECHFRHFIARDKLDRNDTLDKAKELHKERKQYDNFKKKFTSVWNKFIEDEEGLYELLSTFCENNDIPSTPENIRRFLSLLNAPLVNGVTTKSNNTRPAEILLPIRPDGKNKRSNTLPNKSWNGLLRELCKLMQKRHPHDFRRNVLLMSHRFPENPDKNIDTLICDGIYARKAVTSQEARRDCYKLVEEHGYPRKSLVIKDSYGVML